MEACAEDDIFDQDTLTVEVLDTLQPDVSGLVEALEGMVKRFDNDRQWHSASGGDDYPDSEEVTLARQALSQYSEGKQWSDEPPSERKERIKNMVRGQAIVAGFVCEQGGHVNPEDMLFQCDLDYPTLVDAGVDEIDMEKMRPFIHPPKGEE